MNNLSTKLFVPTVLIVAFCLGVIVYISYQQYLSFRSSSAQTTMHLEHEVQNRLFAIQSNNRELANLLANNWSFVDNVALGAIKELLDHIVPFTVHKSLSLINVYDTEGILLACAENPGLFNSGDNISPLLTRMKTTDADSYPVALVHNGKLALLTLKRLEGNYGPIGFIAVGQYLTKSTLTEFDSFFQAHHAILRLCYQDKEYLTLGGNRATDSSAQHKSTSISFLPGTDSSSLFSVLLTEDTTQLEQNFWHQFLIITLVFSFISLVVIIFSRKITTSVTTEIEKSRDELDLRVRERTAELRGSEERFRTLLNNLDSLVYVADMDTYEILFINEYGQKIWGNIIGKTCWKALQARQGGPCKVCTNPKLLDSHGEPKGVYVWEFQNTVDHEWYECRDQAIRWPDGRFVRMEIATNITPRKLSATALAAEKERLAVTLRSIGDGVITTDTEGRVALINKVAETLTGWTSEEANGRPLTEVFNIVNEISREPCENPVEKVLATGAIVGLANHTALIAQNGQERSIADSGAPIRDKESRIIGVVLVFRDITDQLRLEDELIKVKKLESIGVLAGGIAHDFNNILAAILGNIDLSLTDSALTVETRNLLQEAEKASFRARDLTQQLLTFAKGGEPIKEAASLADVIKDSADFVLRGDKVACRYLFPDDLWLVDIDKGQISQVVQNIILNASHAMPGGGIIEVACENVNSSDLPNIALPKSGNFVKMSIKDSGVGMPANVLDKIFDPYFSTKQHGSGLGLAITHSIVNKHYGQITVKSSPGAGTTFTVYLPASAQSSLPGKTAEQTAFAVKSAKILIMDDDEQVRKISQAMLARMGHAVVLAKEGEEAVEIYQQSMNSGTPIDLTIMDLTIPGGLGGKDAVKKILSINPQAKVIVSSGYSTDPILASFKEYGFCEALVKPFRTMDLEEVISQALVEPESQEEG